MKGGDLPKCKVNSKVLKYNNIHPNHLIFFVEKTYWHMKAFT